MYLKTTLSEKKDNRRPFYFLYIDDWAKKQFANTIFTKSYVLTAFASWAKPVQREEKNNLWVISGDIELGG